MRIAVVSCWKYRDAWAPFFGLLQKFWPDCPYEAMVISDEYPGFVEFDQEEPPWTWLSDGKTWSEGLAEFAKQHPEEPILLMQEDFLLNAPVNQHIIEHALKLMERESIGAVRLYPCPGATEPSGDPYFGPVARHTMYRTSCQATIWRPGYLRAIAERYNTPSEFELQGSPWASRHLPAEVWAFKRELPEWPLSYFCSAIGRGLWSRDALEFCASQGIEVDTSLRGIAT